MKIPRISWNVRLCISAVVLLALLWLLPIDQLWSSLRKVSLLTLAGTLGAFLVGHTVAAVKWWLLIPGDSCLPLRVAVRAHFAGLLSNLCLPGVAGGDVVRAGWAMRHSDVRVGIGVASIADRLLDCVALLLLACTGAALTAQLGGAVRHALMAAGAVLVLGALTIVIGYRWLGRLDGQSLGGRVASALSVLASQPLRVARSLALSLIVQGSFVSLNVVLGRAVGLDVPWSGWLLAWPLAKLTATIPISLGGLGVREAAMVVFLRPFGAAAAPVTAASLLWEAVLATGGLIGGLIVVSPRLRETTATSEVLSP